MRVVRWIVRTAAPPLVVLLLVLCAGFVLQPRPSQSPPVVAAALVMVGIGAYAADKLIIGPLPRRRTGRTRDRYVGAALAFIREVGVSAIKRCARPRALATAAVMAIAKPGRLLVPLRT